MYSPPKILLPLLWPLSLIYGAVVVARAWLYKRGILKQKRLNGVVISVGNLTVGGTGKTPMVIWLGERLYGQGKSIGILSRGYKGKVKTDQKPMTIPRLPGTPPSLVIGDEPAMMWLKLGSRVRIAVGAQRHKHGKELERYGVNWFLLDDGFQHLQLARDLNILLIDATDPFRGGKLLPLGGLREPVSATQRADIVVITRSDHAPAVESIVRRHTAAPILYANTFLGKVRAGENSAVEADHLGWMGKQIFAFCAIGNTGAFLNDLRRWGVNLVGHMSFRDHYDYSRGDALRIEDAAVAAGAQALICTEKDTYNLKGNCFRRLPQYVCEITMRIANEEQFLAAVMQMIDQKRGGELPR